MLKFLVVVLSNSVLFDSRDSRHECNTEMTWKMADERFQFFVSFYSQVKHTIFFVILLLLLLRLSDMYYATTDLLACLPRNLHDDQAIGKQFLRNVQCQICLLFVLFQYTCCHHLILICLWAIK